MKPTSYNLKVYFEQIYKIKLNDKVEWLIEEKRALEEKPNKTEADRERLAHKADFWKKVQKFVKQQMNLQRQLRTRKSFSEYSDRNKFRIKNKLRLECESTLEFLGFYDLVPYEVIVFDPTSGEYELLILVDEENFMKAVVDSYEVEQAHQNLDNINLLLYIKAKFNISNPALHELATASKGLPSEGTRK